MRPCSPDWRPYQRGAAHQKDALTTTTAPCRTPEVALAPLRVLTRRRLCAGVCVPSGPHDTPQAQEASMYFIVEITPRGAETFLGGFEELAEAWEIASRLRCEAQRCRSRLRYEVR
jgi:hypothetical protein